MHERTKLLIKQARIKFFRKEFNLNLFGNMLYRFEIIPITGDPGYEGYVKLKHDYTSFDGNIYINEYYTSKSEYTTNNLICLLIHEMLHILDKDNLRGKNKDSRLWNLAGDHVIDRTIKEAFKDIEPYNNSYNIIDELHKIDPKCSKEFAYNWLMQNKPYLGINEIQISNGENGELTQITITMPNGQTITFIEDIKEINNGGNIDQEVKQHVESLIAQMRALNEINKSKGNNNGGLQSYIDKLLEVKIPWDVLIEKSIKKNVIMKPDGRNWNQLNKFYSPLGITLPGVTYSEDHDAIGTLIITIDVSCSITQEELKEFSFVIAESFKYYRKIITIIHSVDVIEAKEFTDKLEFISYVRNGAYKHRGGTSHGPTFNWIEDNVWINGEKDELSLVISLTDGESDIESYYNKYNWLKSIPYIIVLTKDARCMDYLNGKIDSSNIDLIQINN